MKYKLNYGTQAAVIPGNVVEFFDRASLCDLKTIMYVCAMGGECEIDDISAATGFSLDEVTVSMAFWRGAGIVIADTEPEVKKTRATSKKEVKTEPKADENVTFEPTKKIARADKLPEYTTAELAGILENKKNMAPLVTEGQRILGKIFTVHEVNILVGLSDYLGLDNEYILMLLKHCVEIGKKTLHYVEKTAISLYDMGIMSAAALADELAKREAVLSMEGNIRKIFGIGTRALTTKEKKEISSWVYDMKCPVEVIEKAYEVTCDATGKPSLHYANSVIERWHSEGLLTIEQIEASYKNKDAAEPGSSFETDEFFEAAVRRSLGEK